MKLYAVTLNTTYGHDWSAFVLYMEILIKQLAQNIKHCHPSKDHDSKVN